MPRFPQGSLVKAEAAGAATVARFAPADLLDLEVAEAVGEQLIALALGMAHPLLVLDFSAVYCPASAFWGKLMSLSRQVRQRGGGLVLCNVAPDLCDLLTTLRLIELLPVYADENEALQKVTKLAGNHGGSTMPMA